MIQSVIEEVYLATVALLSIDYFLHLFPEHYESSQLIKKYEMKEGVKENLIIMNEICNKKPNHVKL